MNIDVPVMAGMVSTAIFALSTVPMLRKAFTTRDMRSYSLGNIVLANTGNAIHSLYVFHLPPGPIWLLHAFYLVTTGLMLLWYLRYEGWPSGMFAKLRSAAAGSVRPRRRHAGVARGAARQQQADPTEPVGRAA